MKKNESEKIFHTVRNPCKNGIIHYLEKTNLKCCFLNKTYNRDLVRYNIIAI